AGNPKKTETRHGDRRQGRRASPDEQTALREPDGAAILSVRLRRRERSLHALCDEPTAALPAPMALRLYPAHSRAQDSRRLSRRRRRLRCEGNLRDRGLDDRLGRADPAAAAATA